MLKLILSATLGAALMVGCSSSPPAPPTAMNDSQESTPAQVGDVYGNFPSKREPAQYSQTRWAPDSRNITIAPGGGIINLVLNPRQIETYQETFRYTCDQYTWGTVMTSEYVCTGGEGKSELWNAYYKAKKEDKAHKLDQALLGIGKSSAEKLHQSGIFTSKPKSWGDFRTRMNQALRKNVITDTQYNEVFGKYADQNRLNLGYTSENCVTELRQTEVWGLFPVKDACLGTRNAERVTATINKAFKIDVNNPQLQPFETETMTISSAADFDTLVVSRADKTDYKVKAQPSDYGTLIQLQGVGRFQVPLPREALVSLKYNDSSANAINAVISIDPKYLGQGEDKMILSLQTTHCTPGGWFSTGDCKGNDEQAKTRLAPEYFTLTQANSSFALPASIPHGDRVWVSYSLHRENSRWYNPSRTITGDDRLPSLKK